MLPTCTINYCQQSDLDHQ